VKQSRKRPRREAPATSHGRRGLLIAAAVVLAVVIAGGSYLFATRQSREVTAPPAGAGGQVAAGSVAASGLDVLRGRWLRLDGGYILELRSIAPSGAIDAAYLNPRPINVAKAEATLEGSTPKVFVELRAPNYPGSTYTLTYDAQRDQLRGVYFQAVQRQNYDVEFVRMK